MPVDPKKPRKILVLHGIQTGRDEEIKSHEAVEQLVTNCLQDRGLTLSFEIDFYKYENINDKALNKLKKICDILFSCLALEVPFAKLVKTVVDSGFDLLGDVIIKLEEGSTAATILKGLIEKIKKIYKYPH